MKLIHFKDNFFVELLNDETRQVRIYQREQIKQSIVYLSVDTQIVKPESYRKWKERSKNCPHTRVINISKSSKRLEFFSPDERPLKEKS